MPSPAFDTMMPSGFAPASNANAWLKNTVPGADGSFGIGSRNVAMPPEFVTVNTWSPRTYSTQPCMPIGSSANGSGNWPNHDVFEKPSTTNTAVALGGRLSMRSRNVVPTHGRLPGSGRCR
jgi:hypothetical protein